MIAIITVIEVLWVAVGFVLAGFAQRKLYKSVTNNNCGCGTCSHRRELNSLYNFDPKERWDAHTGVRILLPVGVVLFWPAGLVVGAVGGICYGLILGLFRILLFPFGRTIHKIFSGIENFMLGNAAKEKT